MNAPAEKNADKSAAVVAPAAAARLERELDRFLRLQSGNTASSVNGMLESSDGGVDSNGLCRRGAREEERDHGEKQDFEGDGPSPSEPQGATTPPETPSTCGAEDEAKVAAFVRLLKANGTKKDFLKEIG